MQLGIELLLEWIDRLNNLFTDGAQACDGGLLGFGHRRLPIAGDLVFKGWNHGGCWMSSLLQ